jgi:hypothetical protein
MSPEFLGARVVFLQRLLLGVGLTGPRDNEDCRERKNRSIKSRFHRVTPYAALSFFEGFRRTFRSVVRGDRAPAFVDGSQKLKLASGLGLPRRDGIFQVI